MKFHPAALGERAPKVAVDRLDDMASSLIDLVTGDDDRRTTWMARQRAYYNRRYCRLFRNTTWPWKGASDVVMPTIDMTIDRIKADLMRVVFSRPMITMRTENAQLQNKARKDQLFINWLLTTGIKDFKKEIVIAIDTMLQHGFCVLKVFWDYRTRKVSRRVSKKEIFARYGKERQELIEAKSAEAVFGEGANIVGREEEVAIAQRTRAEAAEALRARISQDFGLDPDEPDDRKSLDMFVRILSLDTNAEYVEYKTRVVERDNPRVVAINPDEVIVPVETREVQDACRIVHKLYLSPEDARQRARDHKWDAKLIEEIIEGQRSKEGKYGRRSRNRSGRAKTEFESARNFREGLISTSHDDMIELWECHWFEDIDGDGFEERVWGVMCPDSGEFLSKPREEPYDHGQWPFIQLSFEITDGRFYSSRGVPEKIDDIDIEITKRHRAKLNDLDLRFPMFKYRFLSELNPGLMRPRPGAMFPVLDSSDLETVQIPSFTIEHEREENIMLTWNERYLGGMENVANQNNISEARTATEIRALQQTGASALGMRAEVVQMCMKLVYDMVWDLYNQWGDELLYEKVTGFQFIRLTPEDIRRNFSIIPVGTVTTSDPEVEKLRAKERFLVLLNLWQLTGGLIDNKYRIDIVQALMFWLERENILEVQSTIVELDPQVQQQLAAEAERKAKLIEAAETNQPQTIREGLEAVSLIKKNAPFGGRQKIKTNG